MCTAIRYKSMHFTRSIYPRIRVYYASDFTCLFIFVLFCIKISGNSNLKGTEHRYKKQLAGARTKNGTRLRWTWVNFPPYLSGCNAREPVPDNLAENSLLMNSLSLPKGGNIFFLLRIWIRRSGERRFKNYTSVAHANGIPDNIRRIINTLQSSLTPT